MRRRSKAPAIPCLKRSCTRLQTCCRANTGCACSGCSSRPARRRVLFVSAGPQQSPRTYLHLPIPCLMCTLADRRARTGGNAQGRRVRLAHLCRIPPRRIDGARTPVRDAITISNLLQVRLRDSEAEQHIPAATSFRRTLSRTRSRTESTGTRSIRNMVCRTLKRWEATSLLLTRPTLRFCQASSCICTSCSLGSRTALSDRCADAKQRLSRVRQGRAQQRLRILNSTPSRKQHSRRS